MCYYGHMSMIIFFPIFHTTHIQITAHLFLSSSLPLFSFFSIHSMIKLLDHIILSHVQQSVWLPITMSMMLNVSCLTSMCSTTHLIWSTFSFQHTPWLLWYSGIITIPMCLLSLLVQFISTLQGLVYDMPPPQSHIDLFNFIHWIIFAFAEGILELLKLWSWWGFILIILMPQRSI